MAAKSECFPEPQFNIAFKSTTSVNHLISTVGNNKKSSSDMLEKAGVVYKLSCKKCKEIDVIATYIGETGRKLGTRIAEHLKPVRDSVELKEKEHTISQVRKHAFINHGTMKIEDWDIEILRKAENIQDRKVLESLAISEYKPTLNVDLGILTIV